MVISKDIQLEKALEAMIEQYVYEMWEGGEMSARRLAITAKELEGG
jgi:hypothetical protein